jgi:hypothetical protein
MVLGIQQVPPTNNYVFVIEKIAEQGKGTETVCFDVTTGKPISDDSEKKTRAKESSERRPADSPADKPKVAS